MRTAYDNILELLSWVSPDLLVYSLPLVAVAVQLEVSQAELNVLCQFSQFLLPTLSFKS